jgi:hypothetical protein
MRLDMKYEIAKLVERNGHWLKQWNSPEHDFTAGCDCGSCLIRGRKEAHLLFGDAGVALYDSLLPTEEEDETP